MEFSAWLQECGHSEYTRLGYVNDIATFAHWFEETNSESLSAEDVTATGVCMYREHLLSEKRAARTFNRRLAALRSFVSWAREIGYLKSDPLRGIRIIREQRLAPRWLNRNEVARLIRTLQQSINVADGQKRTIAVRDRAIINIILHTGLRVGELCNLELQDIEILERKGLLRVRQGKGLKQRDIPLNARARKSLMDWLEVRPKTDSMAVFVEMHKWGRVSRRTIQSRISNAGRRADVVVTAHALRHTFAKNLIQASVNTETVASLLGYRNLNTARIYSIPSRRDL